MSEIQVIADRSDIVAIADAVRNKTGTTTELTIDGIVNGINEIQGDGHGECMSSNNPVGTGSFSMNRAEDSEIGENSFAEGQNATASGVASHAEGNNTNAGAFGFRIIEVSDVDKSYIVEDTEGLAANQLEVGDIFTIYLKNNYDLCGKITDIWMGDGSDIGAVGTTRIDVDTVVNEALVEDPSDTQNIFRVPAKPMVGYLQVANYSHAEGIDTKSVGVASHAEGYNTSAVGKYSHAEGRNTEAVYAAHAEGLDTKAYGQESHSEGWDTKALGIRSHSEGSGTTAIGGVSHAEGSGTISGQKCFNIISIDKTNLKITVEDNNDTLSQLGKGDVFNLSYSNQKFPQVGTIQSIDDCTITVSSIPDNFNLDPVWSNRFWVPTKPTAGDVSIGDVSHAEGRNTISSGEGAHSEGSGTIAGGDFSHAEGVNTISSGFYSHAEGKGTVASGYQSHAEGSNTQATNWNTHAEGNATTASGEYAHAEGSGSLAQGKASHSENLSTKAIGAYSHAEGNGTSAQGESSHAEGKGTVASGAQSHAEGSGTQATNWNTHAEGVRSTASGLYSHAEGVDTLAEGSYSHAENNTTKAMGENSHAENYSTQAIGTGSHAEGDRTKAQGKYSHSEGQLTTSEGDYSHTEGQSNTATGLYSHAEGKGTKTKGNASHAEGHQTQAIGVASHAEGYSTLANEVYAHAEGHSTQALGGHSHAEGRGTIATAWNSHVQGKYNVKDTANSYAHIVGNGTADDARSNAHTLDWNGNAWFAGNVSVGANNKKLATEELVDQKIASFVDSAPETLNTLNELAAALGDDPNFATTIATEIGKKADTEYVDNKIGDIETALDNIIAIQNSLVGGENV